MAFPVASRVGAVLVGVMVLMLQLQVGQCEFYVAQSTGYVNAEFFRYCSRQVRTAPRFLSYCPWLAASVLMGVVLVSRVVQWAVWLLIRIAQQLEH
jgi:hypothetical protein